MRNYQDQIDEANWFYARKLVNNLLSRGLYVTTDNNEGEPSTLPTRDADGVLKYLGTTHMDTIRAYSRDAGGLRFKGSFTLIWGESLDPIYSHSGNRLTEIVCDEVTGRVAA